MLVITIIGYILYLYVCVYLARRNPKADHIEEDFFKILRILGAISLVFVSIVMFMVFDIDASQRQDDLSIGYLGIALYAFFFKRSESTLFEKIKEIIAFPFMLTSLIFLKSNEYLGLLISTIFVVLCLVRFGSKQDQAKWTKL